MDNITEGVFLSNYIKPLFLSPEKESYKFGYYNYSPVSADGTKLLGHRIFFEGRDPLPEDKVEIGYFTLTDQKWHKLAESSAFNWQQGSMLQWLGPDFNSKIIFNDSDGEKYIARIINVDTRDEKIIPKAVYGVTPDGKTSISLHFERCNFTRAYSYASVSDETWNGKAPEKDGIIKINLSTGEYKTIIPLHQILKDTHPEDNAHWFEHIMLNPGGTRFSFYHRYGSKDSFNTRCYTADIEGKNVWLHPSSDTDRITHLGWKDNESYVLYTVPKPRLNQVLNNKGSKNKSTKWYIKVYRSIVRPFVPKALVKKIPKPQSYYALTQDTQGIAAKYNPKPGNRDGHPGFTRDGRYMLTDTYADKEGYRHLLLYDTKEDVTYMLGKFKSVYNNCGWRTDLHPRFSPDEQNVIIDSNHNGTTSIIMFALNWELISHKK